MTSLILALLLSTELGDAMKLVAKGGVLYTVVTVQVADNLKKHGASEAAARTQVEAALRRCGMRITSEKELPPSGSNLTLLAVTIGGVDHGAGYAAAVQLLFLTPRLVEGSVVMVLDFQSGSVITGPSSQAQPQVRHVLAGALDELCNDYLQAKEAAAQKKSAKTR